MKAMVAIAFLFIFVSGCVYPAETVTITAVKSRDLAPYDAALMGFKDYLNEVEIYAHLRVCTMKGERKDGLLEIREELKSKTPDLVLTLGTPATKLAQEIVEDVPVLFTMVLDPGASNVLPPGVTMDIPHDEKLRNVKRVLPNAKRIGLIYSQNSISAYEEISEASAAAGLQVIAKEINSGKELAEAFEDISWQIDCFFMITDSRIYFPKSVEYLLRHALREQIPVIGLSSFYTKAGALISFDCNYEDLGRETAEIASKILSGANGRTIKFVGPRKIDFSLNVLVAERLGIKIPSEIIREARDVFGK